MYDEKIRPCDGWEELEKRRLQLTRVRGQLENFIRSNGGARKISVSRSNGVTQFYLNRPGTKGRKYFSAKSDKSKGVISRLIQLEYDKKVLKRIEKELDLISELLNGRTMIEDTYFELAEGKREFVNPVVIPDNKYVEIWLGKKYSGKHFSVEDKTLFTVGGVRVRSKSEIIIGSMLEKFGIPFRYEYPLKLKSCLVYPDFYCLNVRTRREFVWEHFGMMDDGDYVENFVQKIRDYGEKGFFPGKNLIMSFETLKQPLNPLLIEDLIKNYLV